MKHTILRPTIRTGSWIAASALVAAALAGCGDLGLGSDAGPGGSVDSSRPPTPEGCRLYDESAENFIDFGVGSTRVATWDPEIPPGSSATEIVLTAACSPYEFRAGFDVSGATVVAEAGAVIRFGPEAGIILGDGTFRAEGTAEAPVTLTGIGPTWAGIDGDPVSLVLTHTVVENAGDERVGVVSLPHGGAALDIRDTAGEGVYSLQNVRFVNCTNMCIGIGYPAASTTPTSLRPFSRFEDVSLENAPRGFLVYPSTLESFPELPSFVDVEENVFYAIGIATDLTMPSTGLPWRFDNQESGGLAFYAPRVTETGHLTIPAGADLRIDSNDSISIANGGEITAIGTEAAPIVFQGVEGPATPSQSWLGIEVSGTWTAEHYVIRGGGREVGTVERSCLDFTSVFTTPVALRHATITGCGEMCIRVTNNDYQFTETTDVNLSGCEQGYVVTPNTVGSLRGAEHTLGADVVANRIITGNGGMEIQTTQTWDDLGVPWIADDRYGAAPTVQVDGAVTLTIAAGSELRFTRGGLWSGFDGGGNVIAAGTSDNHVAIDFGDFADDMEIRASGSSFTFTDFGGPVSIAVQSSRVSFISCTFDPEGQVRASQCSDVTRTGTTVRLTSDATGSVCP